MRLFPSGIAEGKAFCNRVDERKRLGDNISRIKHTVLMAPRRYGKSSLIRQVMHEIKLPYEWVDFLSVTSKEEVNEKITKAGKSLLFQLSPELRKIQRQTTKVIKDMAPELNLGVKGQSLTLHLTSNKPIAIDDMLLQIDEYAQKVKKRGILVFDEFQQISELNQSNSVEALIRHAVERSKAITYIFSGSNRHLLVEMFSKSTRPLYRLCQAMTIDRISETEYTSFLNQAAREKWGQDLPEQTLQAIFKLTECHPFYLNALCDELWTNKQLPSENEAEIRWSWYVEAHKSIITSDIVSLALNQKRIITALAQKPTNEPYGSDLYNRTKLSLSSVKRSLETLLMKDIVYMDAKGEYRLLDPALRYYLLTH